MSKNPKQILVFLVLLLFIPACGRTPSTPDSLADLPKSALDIDLFVGRAFIKGAQYERYHLTNNMLWRECGTISPTPISQNRSPRLEGDQVLPPEPNLAVKQRRVEILEEKAVAHFTQAVSELLSHQKESDDNLPAAGNLFSLKAPGAFEMRINQNGEKYNFITSVDAVAGIRNETLKRLRSLFSSLRRIGPVICNADTFYGIGRKQANRQRER